MCVDTMTTGFTGAEYADIKAGDTVVVLGIGPIGLMAVAGAAHMGAARIIGVGTRRSVWTWPGSTEPRMSSATGTGTWWSRSLT